MAKKPKTIFGKILKVASKVVLPVAGAVVGLGAITGVVKGVGALKGIGGVLKGGKKVIDKVGAAAVNLVTGKSKEERGQLIQVKTAVKAVQDKYKQYDRLVAAGADKDQALSMVGLSAAEYEASRQVDIYEGMKAVPGKDADLLSFVPGQVKAAGAGCMLSPLLILIASGIVLLIFLL